MTPDLPIEQKIEPRCERPTPESARIVMIRDLLGDHSHTEIGLVDPLSRTPNIVVSLGIMADKKSYKISIESASESRQVLVSLGGIVFGYPRT